MIVGIEVSPLHTGHKVRGIGFYVKRLLKSLKELQTSDIQKFKIKKLKTKEEICRQKYDLLHIPYFHPYFLTLPWPWKIKKPMVVTIHDMIPVKYPNHYPPGIKGKIKWQIQKWLLKQAKLVITDSFSSKYDIADLSGYPLDKIYVICLAAGAEFRKLKKQSEKLKVKEKYDLPDVFCLYVGDVNWNKNIPSLVRACEKAQIRLVIVGKQAVEEDYDKTHPENQSLVWLQDRTKSLTINHQPLIIPLGFVPPEDLVALYNLATVYCQPSFDEGFGLPVLEAMACGCPVISSNLSSLPEVAGDAAILVNPTVNNLAEKLSEIGKNKKLQKELTVKALARAEEFSWYKTAKRTAKIYQLALEP